MLAKDSPECNDTSQFQNPLTDSIRENDHQLETQIFTVLVGIITVLCIVLNVIGVYAFMRMPRTPSNLVYLHLCFTDLIVGIFVTPYSIIILSDDLKSNHREYCIIQGIMFEVSYTTTLFILTYISIDRLLALYMPLKYKEWMSKRTLFWINLATWVFPVLRPIIRYIMAVFTKSDCEDYTYNNGDYFMVCYNTDYIAFVKGDKDISVMVDQCIIVIACQITTFFSSMLVIFRLSHRLHIKRAKEMDPKTRESTFKKTPTITKSLTRAATTTDSRCNSGADIKRSVHHFHAPPVELTDENSIGQGKSGTEDDTNFDDSQSYDDGPIQVPTILKKKRKQEAERHAITTMIIVIMFFIVTYTPSFICLIIPNIYTTVKESGHLWIFLVVDYCTMINSTFLPMVHFSRSHGFKRQLRMLSSKAIGSLRRWGILRRAEDGSRVGMSERVNKSLRNNCGAVTAIITINNEMPMNSTNSNNNDNNITTNNNNYKHNNNNNDNDDNNKINSNNPNNNPNKNNKSKRNNMKNKATNIDVFTKNGNNINQIRNADR